MLLERGQRFRTLGTCANPLVLRSSTHQRRLLCQCTELPVFAAVHSCAGMRTRLRAGLAAFCVSLIAAQAARSPVIIIPGKRRTTVPLTPASGA